MVKRPSTPIERLLQAVERVTQGYLATSEVALGRNGKQFKIVTLIEDKIKRLEAARALFVRHVNSAKRRRRLKR